MNGRPIKFRAWLENERRMFAWCPGFFSDMSPVTSYGDEFPEQAGGGEDVILMQFTGLHDKNGKEIYEGDIFCIQHHAKTNFIIVYCDKGQYIHDFFYACFAMQRRSDILPIDEFAMDYGQVIGNIYENPELEGVQ